MKTTWTEAEERASKIIGKKTLFGVRSGTNGRKVRMFVTDGGDIVEVTALVARVCRKRISKDGWILSGNYGYCPVMGLAETYAAAMGKEGHHPHRKL